MMRQFMRRADLRIQLYFNCPEKMDRITRMLKRVDYRDIMFTIKSMVEMVLRSLRLGSERGGWERISKSTGQIILTESQDVSKSLLPSPNPPTH